MNYLRVRSVAQRLDVSVSTIHRLVQQGVLPKPIKLTPRSVVWRAADIDAAVERIARGNCEH